MNYKKIILFSIPLMFVLSCGKKGCTDPTAINYDSEAEKDDGSCEELQVPSTYVFSDSDGNSTCLLYTSPSPRDRG